VRRPVSSSGSGGSLECTSAVIDPELLHHPLPDRPQGDDMELFGLGDPEHPSSSRAPLHAGGRCHGARRPGRRYVPPMSPSLKGRRGARKGRRPVTVRTGEAHESITAGNYRAQGR
jgi:hypothetical protein